MAIIVFEAGPTHTGLSSAMRLADEAKKAGADAIKFQMVDPERLISDKAQQVVCEVLNKDGTTETYSESLYENLKRYSLTTTEWMSLKKHCDGLGLPFYVTVAYEDEIDFCHRQLKVDAFKICSGDVNHYPLIYRAAVTGLPIHLDTGHSTIGEIETAVDVILSTGHKRIVIHQCPSGYPAHIDSINLRIIPTLKQMFGCQVAFSDHTPGMTMDIAAVALGADMIEKTITLDKYQRSSEHMMSLEPHEMAEFVRIIREVERALGGSRRLMSNDERESRKKIRRSAYAGENLQSGSGLQTSRIVYRRPGYGIGPDEITRQNTWLRTNRRAGEKINRSDVAVPCDE